MSNKKDSGKRFSLGGIFTTFNKETRGGRIYDDKIFKKYVRIVIIKSILNKI